jgi:predicted ArsR family transcriptional regulator
MRSSEKLWLWCRSRRKPFTALAASQATGIPRETCKAYLQRWASRGAAERERSKPNGMGKPPMLWWLTSDVRPSVHPD